jgi:23S rRNA (uracil1939-C5)-methyltransferase
VERANDLARELGRPNASFIAGAWESAGRRLLAAGERFSLATINPMREPVGERALAYLAPLGVERAVYLGPSPVAAAKDIGAMLKSGWRLDALGAANLHPATYHVMLVARLSRIR